MQNNVWKIGWARPLYYIMHPIRLIKDFASSLKWARQRARRGFADVDWVDLNDWLLETLAPMFEEFAENCYSYPGEHRGWTRDRWVDYIRKIASHLRNASREQTKRVNEFEGDYKELVKHRWGDTSMRESLKRLAGDAMQPEGDEEKAAELKSMYFSREKEIEDWRLSEAQTALKMIGEVLFDLWD